MTAPAERLIAEALAKSGVIWLTSAAGSSPVWYAALNDVAYFVTGPGEQKSPAHRGTTGVITRSKETRARLLSYDAEANTLMPEDEDWEAAVAALIAGRLNAPAGDVEARWRENNTIVRLTPDVASVVVRGERITPPVVEPEAEKTVPVSEEPVTSKTEAASEQSAPAQATPERAKKSTATPAKAAKIPAPPPTSQQVATPPVGVESPVETSPRRADTQPIPVRPRKRQAETTQPIPVPAPAPRAHEVTQPIPVSAPAPRSHEVTQPIPVRDRTRRPGSSGEGPGADVTKVDQ